MASETSSLYQPLNAGSVLAYAGRRAELRGIFREGEALEAEEVGDGNLNLVFKVRAKADPRRTVVLKQALPYLRLVGEGWPLPTDRARIEAETLKLQYQFAPEHTPKVFFYDPEMFLTGMQNLDRHIILRQGLMRGIKYPRLAEHIGVFMARMLGGTCDLTLDYKTKKEMVMRFTNPELCKITEDLVFTEPYRPTPRNGYHRELEAQVRALQADESLRVEVAQMKEKFMTHAQALVHGDLHTGSIMVNAEETYAIDPEFAFYGPMGFDVGAVIGNLLLSYASHEVRTADPARRAEFRQYLTGTVIELWEVFTREFQRVVWEKVDAVNFPRAYQEDYMRRILQDAAGMGACKMMRRIIGLAGVADIRGIEDVHARSVAASLALNMGQALLKQRREFGTIHELVEAATACRPSYPWKN